MRAIFRPDRLLFCFLFILNSFLLDMFYAGVTDAGHDQGLAGGAIVIDYGVNFFLVALIISLVVVLKVSHEKIVAMKILELG